MTAEQYANELRDEAKANNKPCPERSAFVDALEARGNDARTKQFKHYDRIIKYMIAAWPELE